MEIKGVSLRRGYELLKGSSEKKKNRGKGVVLEGMVNGMRNGVVSCTGDGGVVRMKIVVRKSELKQLVEVMSGLKSTMSIESCVSSSVEQRLKLLWKRKYVSRTNGNDHKCWTPVLQSIPEEKLV
ncbi:unnamed protein product [Sphenostylis stenocarpa]|uniref:Uncharacterized protein n=1 Tax=Sphenostylis stenocarpa TaxID=92480 RepID=A0AA87B7X9_9FABA|nr:unnamed protein product [Sphenostylis stenocarpa]